MSFDSFQKKFSLCHFLIQGILKALVRDDFRCTLTGAYDIQTVRQNTGFKLEEMDSVVPTECVHILPQSIAVISGTDAKDAKVQFPDLSSVVN